MLGVEAPPDDVSISNVRFLRYLCDMFAMSRSAIIRESRRQTFIPLSAILGFPEGTKWNQRRFQNKLYYIKFKIYIQ